MDKEFTLPDSNPTLDRAAFAGLSDEELVWRIDRLRENFGELAHERDPALHLARLTAIIGVVMEGFCPYDSLPLTHLVSRVSTKMAAAGCIAGHYWHGESRPHGFDAYEILPDAPDRDHYSSYYVVRTETN